LKTVFADTFYFLALLNQADPAHRKAVAFTSGSIVRVITTDWILTELADGLVRSQRGRAEFLSVLADLQADPDATIVSCHPGLMAERIQLYGKRSDSSGR
jgi:predicted nucleic acid-binding protein